MIPIHGYIDAKTFYEKKNWNQLSFTSVNMKHGAEN